MRPLTDEIPKPLLTIQDKSLLAWHLEALATAGIQKVVINHAWLGQKIEDTLGNGSQFKLQITYSPESTALETAGGICQALPLMKPAGYFLVINGDIFCPHFPISQLLETWAMLQSKPNPTLAHLVMVPNPVQHPDGDFYLKASQISTSPVKGSEKLTFSGIGLYHPGLFTHLHSGTSAKLAPLLCEAILKNQVSGEKYAGTWHDVGTPERLKELNAAYE